MTLPVEFIEISKGIKDSKRTVSCVGSQMVQGPMLPSGSLQRRQLSAAFLIRDNKNLFLPHLSFLFAFSTDSTHFMTLGVVCDVQPLDFKCTFP